MVKATKVVMMSDGEAGKRRETGSGEEGPRGGHAVWGGDGGFV
jgi:hypothetical protein